VKGSKAEPAKPNPVRSAAKVVLKNADPWKKERRPKKAWLAPASAGAVDA
jgi:hypothetical protein